jgi:predicted acylesterase/phospholipase RssA
VALEWDDVEIQERLRSAFADTNPVNDYTLPFLSLVRGAKVARLLEQTFGDLHIEDLWRPYFCVSSNLTTGTLAVHRDGPLADALRASISIPGLLPPVIMGQDAHVDGGVMNSLPVDVTGARGATVSNACVVFRICKGLPETVPAMGSRRKSRDHLRPRSEHIPQPCGIGSSSTRLRLGFLPRTRGHHHKHGRTRLRTT